MKNENIEPLKGINIKFKPKIFKGIKHIASR